MGEKQRFDDNWGHQQFHGVDRNCPLGTGNLYGLGSRFTVVQKKGEIVCVFSDCISWLNHCRYMQTVTQNNKSASVSALLTVRPAASKAICNTINKLPLVFLVVQKHLLKHGELVSLLSNCTPVVGPTSAPLRCS